MNPTADNTPGLGLPQPAPMHGSSNSLNPTADAQQPFSPIPPSVPVTGAQQQLPPDQVMSPLPQQSPPMNAGIDTTGKASAGDNSDELDEQWVSKAKAIVEQTKTDPYTESKELNKAKADYLRIRYNKQIKINDDQQQ